VGVLTEWEQWVLEGYRRMHLWCDLDGVARDPRMSAPQDVTAPGY
jgi:hypothetical protein